jgi:hypothetical protein
MISVIGSYKTITSSYNIKIALLADKNKVKAGGTKNLQNVRVTNKS